MNGKSIMVELKNIKRDGDKISCDYYPEGDYSKGTIIVDVKSKKIVKHEAADWYAANSYANHAKQRLLDICNQTPLPETDIVMWY